MNLPQSSLYRIMSERTCSTKNYCSTRGNDEQSFTTLFTHSETSMLMFLPQVLRFKCDTCDRAGTTRKWTSECTRRPCDGTAKRQYFGGRTVRYKMESKKTVELVREQRPEAAWSSSGAVAFAPLHQRYSMSFNASSAVICKSHPWSRYFLLFIL